MNFTSTFGRDWALRRCEDIADQICRLDGSYTLERQLEELAKRVSL